MEREDLFRDEAADADDELELTGDELDDLELAVDDEEGEGAPTMAARAGLGLAPARGSGPPPEAPAEVPVTSRKIRRRGRRTRMRSKTIAMKRLTKEELRLGALLFPPLDVPRPVLRHECKDAPRPCPWVSCKHHLYLDVNPETGSIKLNFPDLEVWEMKETCALDIADRNGITLEEVGDIMNLTRERIRQVEVRGLLKLKMTTAIGED